MPEIGLLPLARVALDVASAVLPTYRSRFSKHQFTQPQLLAILCWMRYEDWTFREAEVRLREHGELRAVLRLSSVPDYTTVYRFLRRLPDDTSENVLGESVRRLRKSSRRGRRRATVAVDGTRLSPHGVSTYFIRRMEQQNCRNDALSTFSEVAGNCRRRSSNHSLATGATRSALRRSGAARPAGRSQPGHAHRPGVGRYGVRLRNQSPAHSPHFAGAQRDPHQSPARGPSRDLPQPDAPRFSSQVVRTARKSGNGVLGNQTKALGESTGSQSALASAPSIAAWPDL
jgi:hypothetical protein